MLNIHAALAVFDFIVCGRRGEAGRYERIVLQTTGYEKQHRHCEEKLAGSPIISS